MKGKGMLVISMILVVSILSGCVSGGGSETTTAAPTTTSPPTTAAPTTPSPTTAPPVEVKAPVQHGLVTWEYYDDARAALEADGKHVLFYFWREQCPWCVAMDDNTFSNPEIVSYIMANFHPVEVDIWSYEAMSKAEASVTGVALGSLFRLGGASPAYGFINSEGNIVLPMLGYMNAEDFMTFLEYIASESYMDMSLQDYKDSL